jgi:hypothetical protein
MGVTIVVALATLAALTFSKGRFEAPYSTDRGENFSNVVSATFGTRSLRVSPYAIMPDINFSNEAFGLSYQDIYQDLRRHFDENNIELTPFDHENLEIPVVSLKVTTSDKRDDGFVAYSLQLEVYQAALLFAIGEPAYVRTWSSQTYVGYFTKNGKDEASHFINVMAEAAQDFLEAHRLANNP